MAQAKTAHKTSITTKVCVALICVVAFIGILLPQTTVPEALAIAVVAIVLNFLVIASDWLYSED